MALAYSTVVVLVKNYSTQGGKELLGAQFPGHTDKYIYLNNVYVYV